MKKFLLTVLMCASVFATSANPGDEKPQKSDYSRWSVGLNAGLPFFWGDFLSFSSKKTYIGVNGEIQLGYQITPTFGLQLMADYGQNKASSRGYAKHYLLGQEDLITYYVPQTQTTSNYGSLYSKIKYFGAGFGIDINVNRLFKADIGDRRWTLLLTPTIYAQKYSSEVYNKSNDDRFSQNSLNQDWCMAVGGSVSVRYRVSSSIDLQFKNTGAWIDNNDFDGVATVGQTKYNAMWTTQLGVIWKIGNKKNVGKRDNLLYYGPSKELPVVPVAQPAPQPAPQPTPAVVERPVQKQEKPKEEWKPVVKEKKIPVLPYIYFKRGSSVVDLTDQNEQFSNIVSTLKEYEDYSVVVRGYCDHYGTEKLNDRLSKRRAQTVKSLLVKNGIAENRILTEGHGIDTSNSDDQARRVEVIISEK